jgi:hypothetical protein
MVQSIFSSAARLPVGAGGGKICGSRAGELKIHWAKPPAGCMCYGFCKARSTSKLIGSDVNELGGQCLRRFCEREWAKMGGAWLAQAWVGMLQATRLLRLDRLELMETAI